MMDLNYIVKRRRNFLSRWKLRRRCSLTAELVGRYAAGRGELSVLDIGACDGAMLSFIKDRFPCARCVGVEPEESFLSGPADQRITLLRGRGEELDLPPGSFDVALLSSVLEHVERPEEMLRRVLAALKPGGSLIMLTVLPAYERLTVGTGFKKNDHFRNYNRGEAALALAAAGFAVVESRTVWTQMYNLTVGKKPS